MAKRIIGVILLIWGVGGFIANVIGMALGLEVIALIPSTIVAIIFAVIGYRLVRAETYRRSSDSGQAW